MSLAVRPVSRVLVLAALLHLVVAALYSTNTRLERAMPGPVAAVLGTYGDYTGARTRFDFFAPAVAPQARASMVLTRDDGSVQTVALDREGAEVRQRLAMMMTFLGNRERRAFIMHAWCVHFIAADPRVSSAEARVEIISLPTLEQARAGVGPTWVPLDRYALRRDQAT